MPAACAAEIETLLNARFDYTCCMRNFLNARLDWSLSTKAYGHDLAMVTGALLAPHMTEYTAKIHEMGTICWYLVTIPIRPIKCLWVTSFYSIIVYHSLRPCLEWRKFKGMPNRCFADVTMRLVWRNRQRTFHRNSGEACTFVGNQIWAPSQWKAFLWPL